MRRRSILTALSSVVPVLAGCQALGTAGDTQPPADDDSATTERPPADEQLVIESSHPVEGTMVNVGASGKAINAASVPLVNCTIKVSGDVGGDTFSTQTTRDRLDVDETWEWEVAFGHEADAKQDNGVENLSYETHAEYES